MTIRRASSTRTAPDLALDGNPPKPLGSLQWRDSASLSCTLSTRLDFEAAKAGNAHLVSIFLAFRADVNHREPKTRRTPLHEAMAQGHERAMWALLCARADLRAQDSDDQAGGSGRHQGSEPLQTEGDERFSGMCEFLLEVPLLDGLLKLRQSGGDEGRMHVSCNNFGPASPLRRLLLLLLLLLLYLIVFASSPTIRSG